MNERNRMRVPGVRLVLVAMLAVAGLAACSDSDDGESADTAPPPEHNAVEGSSEPGAGPLASVLAWGDNSYSEVGNGAPCQFNTGVNCQQPAPGSVVGVGGQGQIADVLSVTAGGFHTWP